MLMPVMLLSTLTLMQGQSGLAQEKIISDSEAKAMSMLGYGPCLLLSLFVLHAYAHFDDLDIDAKSEWLGTGKIISTAKQKQ